MILHGEYIGHIGYQKVIDTRDGRYFYQLRYFAQAEPFGPFKKDPAGTVDKIALIDPKQAWIKVFNY